MITNIKFTFLFLVYALSACQAYANAIDSIKTKEDVVKFLFANNLGEGFAKYLFSREYDVQVIDSIWAGEMKNTFRSNNFYKVDIDNNGRTDLIVDGMSLLIVMDLGNKYEMQFIDGSDLRYFFTKTIQLPDQSTGLLFRHDSWVGTFLNGKTISKIDTIVCKFGGLVEYNEHPASVYIQKIDLWKHPVCFGDCTELFMEFNKNSYAIYYQSSETDVHVSSIDSLKLSELWDLIAYIDIMSLKSNYSVDITELSTAFLNFYFEDGSIKKISDYGFNGTLGLRSLYNKIFELKESQNWQRMPRPPKWTPIWLNVR